ncbi:MAG: class 1 fructose-bisphosphatase [Gaiellales bacterium]|nr:class 1 fructose-bisphosphatase [Gaiellales bacterium]
MASDTLGTTLTRHVFEQQKGHPQATGELTGILNQIALASKIMSRKVNRAGLADVLGYTGEENVQGEEVRRLDELANDVFIAAFDHLGHFCVMASEEVDDAIPIPDQYQCGHYSIAFDPLDGSSNIDANVSVGTIFAIHHKVSSGPRGENQDLLQCGTELVAAGYVVYGSSTMLVLSTGRGVDGFTLDPEIGEFLLSHPGIRIPERGKIYSCNEGNYPYWSEGVRRYIDYIKTPDKESGRPYSTRYIGSMVADIHRTLLYGGIFMYPADTKKNPDKAAPKLRLLYECSPMAFLLENAGGAASTGRGRVLEVTPEGLHQRVPFFGGSLLNVRELEEFVERYDAK